MSLKLDSRWSKRGIKKCPHCNVYNGHRAVRCKNKLCGKSLKEAPRTDVKICVPKDCFVAVQLRNGLQEQSKKLYSVRNLNGTNIVRGFVEIREDLDRTDDQALQSQTAVCYVGCDLQTYPATECQHVRVASETTEVAEAMVIRKECIDLLNIPSETRETIWRQQGTSSVDNPLVQKVSADTFVVKCNNELQQRIPYCHVQLKEQSSIICDTQNRGICVSPNHEFMVAAAIMSTPKYRSMFDGFIEKLLLKTNDTIASLESVSVLDGMALLHDDELVTDLPLQNNDQFLIATIQDPASIVTDTDIQLVDCSRLEFDTELGRIDFTQSSVPISVSTSPVIELINSTDEGDSAVDAFVASYNDTFQLMDCQIELMDQFNLTDRIDFCPSDIELSEDIVARNDDQLALNNQTPSKSLEIESVEKDNYKGKRKLIEVTAKKTALRQSSKNAKEKLRKGSYSVRKLLKVLESNGIVFNRLKPSEAMQMASANKEHITTTGSLPSYEAILCELSFTSWLESVIEQLNSVIVYEGSGKPDTQIFSIHENFFKCLRARFSVGHCLRMPDHTKVITEGMRQGLSCEVYNFSCYKSLRNALRTDKKTIETA
ncbi:uncharacterized protein LOC129767645 isoform X2 [Toxorhynchites rutilus septentrionalis]|uniref:uncharacterized protein LOC129767645 isoform X2 n=1 Tax=Toxorhynchites rutilus septentrionalis TaxID=329112 RepID=UPI002479D89D|nr:uncharacterized protein LOC129767645 isoform X2 [Toxorhynchites rutilus septentrionalis]